jgi:nitrate reductase NapAB chaperone NapD
VIISGIVMASRPEHLVEMSRAVETISWADVHFSDPSGRLVVTIEAADLDQSVDRLRRLQELPRVLMAELAQYCIEERVQDGLEEQVQQHETGQAGERDEERSPPPADPDSH